MHQIRLTNFVNDPKSAMRHLAGGPDFLCRHGTRFFVACIQLNPDPDRTMPPNCEDGCLYVDDVIDKCCKPINRLDEIYEIEELPEDANEGPTNQEKREMRLWSLRQKT